MSIDAARLADLRATVRDFYPSEARPDWGAEGDWVVVSRSDATKGGRPVQGETETVIPGGAFYQAAGGAGRASTVQLPNGQSVVAPVRISFDPTDLVREGAILRYTPTGRSFEVIVLDDNAALYRAACREQLPGQVRP